MLHQGKKMPAGRQADKYVIVTNGFLEYNSIFLKLSFHFEVRQLPAFWLWPLLVVTRCSTQGSLFLPLSSQFCWIGSEHHLQWRCSWHNSLRCPWLTPLRCHFTSSSHCFLASVLKRPHREEIQPVLPCEDLVEGPLHGFQALFTLTQQTIALN